MPGKERDGEWKQEKLVWNNRGKGQDSWGCLWYTKHLHVYKPLDPLLFNVWNMKYSENTLKCDLLKSQVELWQETWDHTWRVGVEGRETGGRNIVC